MFTKLCVSQVLVILQLRFRKRVLVNCHNEVISKTTAHGYSSYGNQIGLATTYVREYFHPGFVAKRMELGAVVGAAPKGNVVREKPEAGDVIYPSRW